MRCGRRNRSISFNREGDIFILYLHVCHVFPGEDQKRNPDAALIVLCPTCHWYYDHPRGSTPEGVADWFFIGEVARIQIEKEAYELARMEQEVRSPEYQQIVS